MLCEVGGLRLPGWLWAWGNDVGVVLAVLWVFWGAGESTLFASINLDFYGTFHYNAMLILWRKML